MQSRHGVRGSRHRIVSAPYRRAAMAAAVALLGIAGACCPAAAADYAIAFSFENRLDGQQTRGVIHNHGFTEPIPSNDKRTRNVNFSAGPVGGSTAFDLNMLHPTNLTPVYCAFHATVRLAATGLWQCEISGQTQPGQNFRCVGGRSASWSAESPCAFDLWVGPPW